uniref:Immunoglobulin V-set domain-containing protein n=1 Tax=Sparus aurata TaxID=8175 RepID=A0A671VGM5_SPAAU
CRLSLLVSLFILYIFKTYFCCSAHSIQQGAAGDADDHSLDSAHALWRGSMLISDAPLLRSFDPARRNDNTFQSFLHAEHGQITAPLVLVQNRSSGQPEGRLSVSPDWTGDLSLTVKDAQLEDGGNYVCYTVDGNREKTRGRITSLPLNRSHEHTLPTSHLLYITAPPLKDRNDYN